MQPVVLALLAARRSTLGWLIHLGGPSLIVLGLLDNSLIPLPGSMDVVTILLAAHRREPWFYYAFLATAGALLGGYLTYDMARKGGKEAFKKRFSTKKADRIYTKFDKWGFAAVAVPAMLPPPFPIVPMLLAAGALQYSTRKFLAALALGRAIRYSILAYLGAHYGRHLANFFTRYYWPTLIALIALFVIGGLYGLLQYLRRRRASRRHAPPTQKEIDRRAA